MTPFFHLFIAAFYFCISGNSKFKFNGVPPFHYVLVCKNTHLHAKDDTFKPVRVDILFCIKFGNFWYIIRFVPNLKIPKCIQKIWEICHYF